MKQPKQHRGITVFYSYASADKELRDQLANHLIQLKRDKLMSEWHDQQILAGSDRVQVIDEAIHSAHLILLLISTDFLASDTCYQIEMRQALERHQRGDARVVPIILRPCDWQSSPFVHLQCLPHNSQPITTWSNRDEAFADVVTGIRSVIEDLVLFEAETPLLILPSVWTLPYRRNPFFTGREQILMYLHEKLTSHKSVALTQPLAISGLGGVGKTQTAIEYAYRYRNDYSRVLWVRADTPETLISDFMSIANLLNLNEKNAQHQHLIVNAVKNWLEASAGWLLILDNADDLTFIQDFLPANGKGHTLITTRARPMGKLAQRVEIDKMEMEEALLFVLRRADIITPDVSLEAVSSADRAQAYELVTLVDGLPLALDQAGAYMEETGTDLSHYLKLYKMRRKALLKRRSKFPTDHPEPVASTWLLSFQRIEKRNSVAADLLRFCAFLQPDAIPEELLTEGIPELGNALEATAGDPLQLDEAIGDLLSFSLVRRHPNSKTLSLHRLVQVVLKDEMDEQTQRSWVERVICAINRAFPKEGGAKTWPNCQRCLPHVLVCAQLIEQWNIFLPEAAQLLLRSGIYAYNRSQFKDSEILLKGATTILEQIWGPEHPDTMKSLFYLAVLYQAQGRDEQAEPLLLRTVKGYELVQGLEHYYTAVALDMLATFYIHRGQYEKAEPLIKQALVIFENKFGTGHLRIVNALITLARLYVKQGKYKQAEPLIERSMTILGQEREPKQERDSYIANMLFQLAGLYFHQEKYEQAEALYQRTLSIGNRIQQGIGPVTAQSLHNLARIYIDQGKHERAEPLLQRAIKIWEQVMGLEHKDTAYSLVSLASIYKDQGKYEQAELLYLRALRIGELMLGSSNPLTRETAKDFAALLRTMGRETEARQLDERFPLSS